MARRAATPSVGRSACLTGQRALAAEIRLCHRENRRGNAYRRRYGGPRHPCPGRRESPLPKGSCVERFEGGDSKGPRRQSHADRQRFAKPFGRLSRTSRPVAIPAQANLHPLAGPETLVFGPARQVGATQQKVKALAIPHHPFGAPRLLFGFRWHTLAE